MKKNQEADLTVEEVYAILGQVAIRITDLKKQQFLASQNQKEEEIVEFEQYLKILDSGYQKLIKLVTN